MANIVITYPNKYTARLSLTSVPDGTTQTQWKFVSPNETTVSITTPSTAGNVTDSAINYIELHLVKFQNYTVSVRHKTGQSYTPWTEYIPFENRGITNSYEHYLAITDQFDETITLYPI